ncbi:MAG: PhnD/SsuA/transferrin family substrate-binding protein [Pseudomonadota bacterium]
MYDRAELRSETDTLWAAIRDALRTDGVDAPERLTRTDPEALWKAPDLVLAQTCGLPYALRLSGQVVLVGTPAYRIEGCGPGEYRSALVVRADDPAEDLSEMAGRAVAVNAVHSQSGHSALRHAVAPLAKDGRFLGAALLTRSHAASIVAVADGRADLAAIDAVTWALAERHDPVTARLRVLAWTEPTPGLPLIAGPDADAAATRRAVAAGIAAVPDAVRDALMLDGLKGFGPADYAPLAVRFRKAEAASSLVFEAV